MIFISAWGIGAPFSKHRVAAGRLFRHRLHHIPVFNNPSIFNSKKFRDCDPWIAFISLQMDVQSDNISISDSFMDGDSQAGMLLEHPFNELDKAVRPVFGHLRIMLGIGKSDVSASRFGWLILVYREFVERRYELFVFSSKVCAVKITSNRHVSNGTSAYLSADALTSGSSASCGKEKCSTFRDGLLLKRRRTTSGLE